LIWLSKDLAQCLVSQQYVRTKRISRNDIPNVSPENQIGQCNRMLVGYFVNIRPFSYLIVSQDKLPMSVRHVPEKAHTRQMDA